MEEKREERKAFVPSIDHKVDVCEGDFETAQGVGDEAVVVNNGFCGKATVTGQYATAVATNVDGIAEVIGPDSVALSTFGDAVAWGEDAVAIAICHGSKVRGGLGAWLVAADVEVTPSGSKIVGFVSAKVDGEKIKEATWYVAYRGKLVEVPEQQ